MSSVIYISFRPCIIDANNLLEVLEVSRIIIQGVSGGIVNVLGGGIMDYSK